jgi:dTDP-glucose 4,6-dehydratase
VWPELRNARLFITGGTGFFGKWLLETFQHANRELALNASAIILSRNPGAFLQEMPHLANDPSLRFIEGDIASFAFPGGDITHLIHAATETTTRHGPAQPLQTLETIVTGTRRVLDLARERPVQSLLFTSSGAVYGRQPPELTHIPEDYTGAPDPMDRHAAYANGKRLAEHLCCLYHAQHAVPARIARCFAFIGPHLPLNAHFAAGNFIRDAMAGGPIRVNGDGTPYRSYLYAADLAVWLWTILVRGENLRPYNVGSGEAISIRGLAETIAGRCSAPCVVAQAAAPGAVASRYVPSVARAERELDLRVNIPLDEAIRRTLKYHRASVGE